MINSVEPVSNSPKKSGLDESSHEYGSYHDSICSHLYHNCYLQGLYSDLHVHIRSTSVKGIDGLLFKLHRVMALRSPILSSLMAEQESSDYSLTNISLSIDDPNITQEGLSIAFGHLYGSFSQSLLSSRDGPTDRSSLLRSVLAAAHLLALGDLAALSLEHIRADIHLDTVLGYSMLVSNDLQSSVSLPHTQPSAQETPISLLRYGSSYTTIRETLFTYLSKGILFDLVERFGLIWGNANKTGDGYKALLGIFADLPFDLLKCVIEYKGFEIPSDMERFNFAKDIVAARAKAAKYGSPVVRGEENVLLAFGSTAPDATAVALVRKLPKRVESHSGNPMHHTPSGTAPSTVMTTTSVPGGMSTSVNTGIPMMNDAPFLNNNAFGFSSVPERRLWKFQE